MMVSVLSIRYAEVLAHANLRLQDSDPYFLQWGSKIQTPKFWINLSAKKVFVRY